MIFKHCVKVESKEVNLHFCWNSRWWCYCWPVVKRLPSKIRGPKGENWDGIACEQPPPPRLRRPLRPPRSANLRRHLLTSEISEREVIKTSSSLRKMTHSVGTLGQQRVKLREARFLTRKWLYGTANTFLCFTDFPILSSSTYRLEMSQMTHSGLKPKKLSHMSFDFIIHFLEI